LKKIKKALVTGGAGFIGSHLVDALLAGGAKVTVLDNLSTGHRSNLAKVLPKINFIEGDICHRGAVEKAADGCDVIFHEAAVVSVPQTVDDPIHSAEVNQSGTLTVLDVARTKGAIRVILASSCAIYGDDPAQPKHEGHLPRPKSPYALQKFTGEMYARLYCELYGLETISLRYFNVYGPRQDPSSPYSGVISIFMNKVEKREAPVIYGDGEQSRDFIFVKDVVRANLMAATTDDAKGQAINVGTGVDVTINKLWKIICNLSGHEMSPHYEAQRLGDIQMSLADIQNANRIIGFSPAYRFKNGIETTFKWYQRR